MINVVERLEFNNVFPDEEPLELIEYLRKVSKFTLLNVIGFTNTRPLPNYDNFFSNPEIKRDVIRRVVKFSLRNEVKEPILITREGSLKLAEVILQNREELINSNINDNRDEDEINLFKSFLLVNQELNSRLNIGTAEDNFERLVDILISTSFPVSDISLYQDDVPDFAKLLYVTLHKFDELLAFIKSNEDYKYLEEGLVEYFGMDNVQDLVVQVKFLFAKLFELKSKNGYKWRTEDDKSIRFLDALVGEEIIEDDDFTNLKNYPIYKLDDNTYSVIDYFFVLDKFFKSVRFVIKNCFNKYHKLPANDRTFFEWYNTNFSENHLMANLLNDVFAKDYISKKIIVDEEEHEPDYYARHNKRIYLFEHKDVLIRKDVKSSGDIEKIYATLKNKFLVVNNRPIGIGQLVNSIEQILNQNFAFDKYVNEKRNFEVYPILLVSDRIFDILGLNYKMNEWFRESLEKRLGDKHNLNRIKPLTLMDIDTLIYWLPHLGARDRHFKDLMDIHHKKMTTRRNVSHPNMEEAIDRVNRGLTIQLAPFSHRFPEYAFPIGLLMDKFIEITTPLE